MTHALDIAALVSGYSEGNSVAALARRYRVDCSAVRLRLIRAGVILRSSADTVAANLRRDPAMRARMGAPRRHAVDEGYFDRLSPNVAYVVGLMQADGSNYPSSGLVTITLRRSDRLLVEAVATEWKTMAPIRDVQMEFGWGTCVAVYSRRLAAGLAAWGVASPKTYTASTHRELLENRDYWRGVVDGDGSLCISADGRRLLSVVGSRPICEEFLRLCQGKGAGLARTVRPHKSIWSVHIEGTDAVLMADWLYRDAVLALDRKARIAANWAQPT